MSAGSSNKQDNIQCSWPACSKATKCSRCGKKLCHLHDGESRLIEGHFVFEDVVFCVDCWDRKRHDTSNHTSLQGINIINNR